MELDLVKQMFSSKDYANGMNYYRQGRVLNMVCNETPQKTIVSCYVRGSSKYFVQFYEKTNGQIYISCTCPRFLDVSRCKHIAAAMIAYVENPDYSHTSGSDRYVKRLLRSYLQMSQASSAPVQQPAQLVPRLSPSYGNHYPSFSFRVGYSRLYAVKNIQEFLCNVDQRKTTTYGKNLTLDHSIEQFEPKAQEMIHLLMNEYSQFRDLHTSSFYAGNNPSSFQKNVITLTGDAFDRWFELLSDAPLECDDSNPIQLSQKDPKVSLQIKKKQDAALLTIDTPFEYAFFGSNRNLYALGGDELLHCSNSFREKIYPLLEQERSTMQIALEDLPTFCSCVLPEISDQVEIEDQQGLLQDYLPDVCTVCFYFDMEQDTLLLRLVFRYDEHSFTPADAPSESDGVCRNIKEENAAVLFAKRYFQQKGNQFVLFGEDAAYDFLIDSINEFRQRGEVYLSDRLNRKQLRPAPVNVGLSVSDGILSLTLDTGGYPPEELSDLYQSMLLRRKYHRLSDGRYLKLNGSSCEKIAEMAKMLQLSTRELAKGKATLPAYRALYLDDLLSGSDGIQINRDSHFRSMVRNFKTLSESDYMLPQGLNAVLRPYQQIGYQWLKTLENYGFGGILADEMGLGKTLQVITFLATVPYQSVGAPNLVICPASLIYNWGDELTKFAPHLRFSMILGSAAERESLRMQGETCDIWITSYELLRQDIEAYAQRSFYCCILDEAQHIKNVTTQASKAVKRLQCRQRFVLTGTPIENRLSELWNLFDFLMPGYLYTNHAFREKLEKPILKSKNSDAVSQLRRLVQPFLLRRLKADVLKELPPKEEHIRKISLSVEEQKLYYACVQTAITDLGDEQGKLKILAALTRLRQICCDPDLCFENYAGPTSKLDVCAELCEAMVANGHQILLFSQFTSMLEQIRARLDTLHISNFTLQGATSKEKRAAMVRDFNAGDASVFLISLKAGGTGLNLTAADIVIHYDPWWNQAAQDQATDRAHRIGQQAHVQVYKLIAKDTIEEKILELQEKKTALLDTISGCEEAGILNMSSDELLSLLKI
jgi:superfamily II DNA or RNA helicase